MSHGLLHGSSPQPLVVTQFHHGEFDILIHQNRKQWHDRVVSALCDCDGKHALVVEVAIRSSIKNPELHDGKIQQVHRV